MAIQIPEGCTEVLLHACCAPCSSAIVEWLVQHGVRPTIFYYNPNIWPRQEYETRKQESQRHAESLGLEWIDGDYDHDAWRHDVGGMEQEPERGRRCEQCFRLRLLATARKAQELGMAHFATTLASSRWKSLEQIARAGLYAEQMVNGQSPMVDGQPPMVNGQSPVASVKVRFWAQNWRKGGLQERRNQLLKEYAFYNQQYCGCEFSAAACQGTPSKEALRRQMRQAADRHRGQRERWSAGVVGQLLPLLEGKQVVMAYWPLPDEVDIRPLIRRLVADGRTVLLPRVTGPATMELRRYTSEADMAEGAFHIMEPTGAVYDAAAPVDVALVPGMAFDAAGHRLGRGRGYYDRFLAARRPLPTIGVCFPYQRVAEVPAAAHDISVGTLVTALP